MATRFKRDIFTGKIVKEEYEPSPNGRTVIFRGELPFGPQTVQGRCNQPAIRPDKPHISMSLGVPPQQAARHTKNLRDNGITDAHYSTKTGFLVSESREGKAGSWASRGYFDWEAGNVEQRYANAIGF